jgi:acyl-CoA oxidase
LALPTIYDEAACAEQMRQLVMGKHLLYKTLETNPEYLLRATRHLSVGDHGALGTRYTVQYNLFAGSVVAMGTDQQRESLYSTQEFGELGCFAFTELGAGVLSGAGVETTAVYDADKKEFCIHSPCPSATKTWISQGCYAEHAVILASLIMPDGSDKGPHLFFSRIQTRDPVTGVLTPLTGVTVSSLDAKIALQGLDNAYITFDHFILSKEKLLSRFSDIDDVTGEYVLRLPKGNRRMLDLLISRLLTGRVCLSEYTLLYAKNLINESYTYACNRNLWISKRQRDTITSNKMSDKPLIAATFTNYSEAIAVIAAYIANTREATATAIHDSLFSSALIESVCVCKFVGTSFGVDVVSVMRKMMVGEGEASLCVCVLTAFQYTHVPY